MRNGTGIPERRVVMQMGQEETALPCPRLHTRVVYMLQVRISWGTWLNNKLFYMRDVSL